ncbi:MAG TPA: tetratricopeptide repeat protein [Methylocella sp.]|nr:tetratricopeptide repeat protein [Methylocella sp.]
MPIKIESARKDRGNCRQDTGHHILAAVLFMTLVVSAGLASAQASSRENLAIAQPFEVGESPAGNYLAARVASEEHDTVAEATFFREALRFDPRNSNLIESAFVAAVSNGNMQDAFGLAERLLAHDPNNNLAHLALGIQAIKAKRFVAARSYLGKGNRQSHDLASILLAAWTYAGSGNSQQAFVLVDRLRGENLAVFRDFHAALIADAANNRAEALRRSKAAYAVDKDALRLVDAHARIMLRNGDRDGAIRTYQAFDQGHPNHPIVTAALADIKAGKPIGPLVKNAQEGAAEVLYGLGAAASQQGDEIDATIYLRLALYLTPQNSLAIITLGDLCAGMKQNEQAIGVYGLVPENDPLRTVADIQTAQVLETLGRQDEADKYLKRVVDDNPKNVDALSALGNLQRAHKHYEEAIETYTLALAGKSPPENSDWLLYYFRGISYERAKRWPEAEADLLQALALNPNEPRVMNYLGYSWVDQGLNLDEAFKMLERAVELRPKDGYIVDSLGWANYRLGRNDEAVRQLERAIDLEASDPVINDHLGDAYWRVGRKLEAHFQWNHARDLGPEPEDKARILEKIEHGLDDEPKPAAAQAEEKKDATAQKKNGG